MKKIVLALGLFGFATVLFAQQAPVKDNYPYHTLSKEVQKIQYKDVEYTPAEIKAGDPALTSGKAVQQRTEVKDRNVAVVTKGYPTWTISKGIARRNK